MPRQKRCQMSRHTNGTDPWSTPSMGDTEGFVQVEVADIRPEGTRSTETHLGIEIGAVEVDLAAIPVHHLTDVADAGFKHPMG